MLQACARVARHARLRGLSLFLWRLPAKCAATRPRPPSVDMHLSEHGTDTRRRFYCRRRAPLRLPHLMSLRLPRPQCPTQHLRSCQPATWRQAWPRSRPPRLSADRRGRLQPRPRRALTRRALPRAHSRSGRSPPRRACSRRRCPRLQRPPRAAAAPPPHLPAAQRRARRATPRPRPRQPAPWRQARPRRPHLRRMHAAAAAGAASSRTSLRSCSTCCVRRQRWRPQLLRPQARRQPRLPRAQAMARRRRCPAASCGQRRRRLCRGLRSPRRPSAAALCALTLRHSSRGRARSHETCSAWRDPGEPWPWQNHVQRWLTSPLLYETCTLLARHILIRALRFICAQGGCAHASDNRCTAAYVLSKLQISIALPAYLLQMGEHG